MFLGRESQEVFCLKTRLENAESIFRCGGISLIDRLKPDGVITSFCCEASGQDDPPFVTGHPVVVRAEVFDQLRLKEKGTQLADSLADFDVADLSAHYRFFRNREMRSYPCSNRLALS